MHEEEQISARHRRESIRLGSLITGAVGIGLMVFLRGVAHQEPVCLVGLIPFLIGVALFVHAQFLAPRL
jgi:MFS superfamily sulfate permease-like transporter